MKQSAVVYFKLSFNAYLMRQLNGVSTCYILFYYDFLGMGDLTELTIEGILVIRN